MKTVYFKISDKQAKEVEALMENEGYTSKAEFFRFLLKFFKYQHEKIDLKNDSLEDAVDKLTATVTKIKEEGRLDNLPSLEEQLSDV